MTSLKVPQIAALNGRAIGKLLRTATRATDQLTKREREVCNLIGQGLTNREIARLLFISESTAKVHVRHILEKTGARSRTILKLRFS